MTRPLPRAAAAGSVLALAGTLLAGPDLPRGGAGSLAPPVPRSAARPAGPRGAAYVLDPTAGAPATEPAPTGLSRDQQFARIRLLREAAAGQPDPPPVTRRAEAARVADGYDLLVFAAARPVRVRLVVSYDGKPADDRWQTALRAAFAYFDRDGDGALNAYEAQQAFGDAGLAQLVQNGFLSPAPLDRPTVERLDADGDRRVSYAEFAAHYKLAARAALAAQPVVPDNPSAAQVTRTLFKLLDADGDGKLTRAELAAVEPRLAARDADEDECLSFAELVQTPPAGGVPGRVVVPVPPPAPAPNGTPAGAAPPPAGLYEFGRIPGTVTQRVLKQYDADGDFELTRGESGFDEGTFGRLDADGDGRLSGEELDAWRTGPPDLEVALRLGPAAADRAVEVRTPARTADARGLAVRRADAGRVVLQIGRQSVDLAALSAPATTAGGARFTLKQQFGALFAQAAGTKGYVDEKDLAGPTGVRYQQLKVMFEPADRDADGRLTREEFDRYLDVQQGFADLGLSLTPVVQTPTLFQLIDDDRDGRLSVRELRTAFDRLLALEPPGAAEVTASAIQPAVAVRLTRNLERGLAFQQAQFVGGPNPGVAPAPARGPVWFRKMDRNGDGDLSRSEFLGTRAEFDAIDADRDGLIGLAEAEAHDKKARK